ncbi:MAG: sulfatase-like hydrolase/transferase, partial [Verrucomicrobiota bacterium]
RETERLEKTGKAENTLVIFTSDNGPETLRRYRGAGRSFGVPDPLRGMKLWTTEAGFRVCGIAQWRGQITAGQTIDAPVSSLDFLPTFCELAGAEIPNDLSLDGISVAANFGAENLERPKPLIWCYYNSINENRVAMRHEDWKVIAKLNGGNFPKTQNLHTGNADAAKSAKLTDIEIYNVAEDIDESEELSAANPEKLAQLQQLLESAYADLIADSPVWKPAS